MPFVGLEATFAASPTPSRTVVYLRGSDNIMPMIQRAAERYMHDHADAHIVVSGGGTRRGYKSVLDGTADIAMASSLQPEEFQTEDSARLITTTLGRVAMVPIVHPSSALRDLTTRQLRGIFSGRITNLKQLAGKDMPLRVLIGSPSDGITESWRATLLGENDHYTPKAAIVNVKERIERVSADAGAIAFISVGDLDPRVRTLTVNGEKADAESVGQGRYTLLAPLMLVTTDHPSAGAKDFIRYLLSVRNDLRVSGNTTLLPAPESAASKP